MRGSMQIAGLIRIVSKTAFHVPGIGLGYPGHQAFIFSWIIKDHGNHIQKVLYGILFFIMGFSLNFLLGLVIVLLHKHKNGTDACQTRRDKYGREK